MESFEQLDAHQVLGIPPTADAAAIRQGYLREIARYHPDRFANKSAEEQRYAAQRSQRITQVYNQFTRTKRPAMPPVVSPASPEAQLQRAQELIQQGEAAAAIPLLQSLLKRDPHSETINRMLAEAQAVNVPPPQRRWLLGALLAAVLIGGGGAAAIALRRSDEAPTIALAPATSTPAALTVLPPTTPAVLPPSPPPPTNVPPTTAPTPPPTAVPPTEAPPPTVVPATETSPPPTVVPPTEVPPPTAIPPTAVPPTRVPPTRVPPTAVPPTRIPPTAVPPTPVPVALEGGVLLLGDNFNVPGLLTTIEGEQYSLETRDGLYAMRADAAIGGVYSQGGPLRDNVVFASDVTVTSGAGGLLFGPNSSYRFVIDDALSFRVERTDAAGVQLLVGPRRSRALRRGTNRLVVRAQGQTVELFANGLQLATLRLPSSVEGWPWGYIVIGGDNPGIATFDNLAIRTALP